MRGASMFLLLPALGAVVTLSACTTPAPTPTAVATATVAATPDPSTSAPASAGPSASAPASAAAAGPSSAAAPSAADPGRPAAQCADSALRVGLGQGEGAAGTGYTPIVFTNTGSTSCVLRGFPGVSVVGGGNGTQLGRAATRDGSTPVDVRLDAHGGQAHATLASVDFAANDGSPIPGCTPKHGDGYRVYPPHSTRAFFVRASRALACDPGPSFMKIQVVASGADGGR